MILVATICERSFVESGDDVHFSRCFFRVLSPPPSSSSLPPPSFTISGRSWRTLAIFLVPGTVVPSNCRRHYFVLAAT